MSPFTVNTFVSQVDVYFARTAQAGFTAFVEVMEATDVIAAYATANSFPLFVELPPAPACFNSDLYLHLEGQERAAAFLRDLTEIIEVHPEDEVDIFVLRLSLFLSMRGGDIALAGVRVGRGGDTATIAVECR